MNSGLYFSVGPRVSRICLFLRCVAASPCACAPPPPPRPAPARRRRPAPSLHVRRCRRSPRRPPPPRPTASSASSASTPQTRPPVVAGASSAAPSSSRDAAQRKPSRSARVLVLGGTGRVGGSTATALSKLHPDLSILIGGRNSEKGESFAAKLGEQSEFVQVDVNNASMLEDALQDVKFSKKKCSLVE